MSGPYNLNEMGGGGGGGGGVPIGAFVYMPTTTPIEYYIGEQYYLRSGWVQTDPAKFDETTWRHTLGANWTFVTQVTTDYIVSPVDVESNGNTLILLTTVASANGNSMAKSTDNGLTWALMTAAAPNVEGSGFGWNGIEYGAGKWVIVGPRASIATSTDGTNWTLRPVSGLPAMTNIRAIKWNGSLFVAVGENAILTSPDGITWTMRSIPEYLPNTSFQSVDFGVNTWVVLGGIETCVTAPADGIQWTKRTIALSSPANCILWDSVTARFYALGNGRTLRSADGVAWETLRSGIAYSHLYGRQFARVGDHFCLATGSTILRSTDMVNFASLEPNATNVSRMNWCKKVRNNSVFAFGDTGASGNQVGVYKPSTAIYAGFNLTKNDNGMVAYVRIK